MEDLKNILKNIKINAEDIVAIIDFGIKPLVNSDDYEMSAEKFDKLIEELFSARDRISKEFTTLRRKIWGVIIWKLIFL